MTGSVLVPIKALVWIFQEGHLSGLLGFQSFGAIEVWVPVLVFVLAFGLSMDDEVFLLSRITEAYDENGARDRAVAVRLLRSGRILTSAAARVVIVLLGFALGDSLGIKQMGLASAIAVAVDATLVRCILVPGTMTLLGRANRWAPAPLRRLHDRIGLTHAGPTEAADARTLPQDAEVDRRARSRAGSDERIPPATRSALPHQQRPGRAEVRARGGDSVGRRRRGPGPGEPWSRRTEAPRADRPSGSTGRR